MSAIKNYILQQLANKTLDTDKAKQLLLEYNQLQSTRSVAAHGEIAIVGMAGRFPKAENVEEFWDILRNGINCIDDYPEARKKDFEHILRNPWFTEFLIGDAIDAEDIPHAHAKAGYLNQIDKFDAEFFGIPPSEATFMDPYQRIALETTWETMEDAGYGGNKLFGKRVGIYLGKENTNYSLYRYCSVKDPMQLTGSWESIMASRISYLFNFSGPCMVIDTACSAGLVSIHMAARAILNGECDTAIAGGINLSVTGEFNTRFQGGMNMNSVESNDSSIRTFDARANGTVWGEGVAFVMLKPLQQALDDGDHIHAIIKGSAINNDGASNGLTAPNAEAQEEVIVQAWKNAGISPETLQYIEAHGTGTVLGDPIEFKGLSASFRRFTKRKQFCAIGSLKTNMGHLVGASGCASLFKIIKQLQYKQMAPTINFSEPNPYIQFQNSPLYVNDVLRDWQAPDNSPRRAALSSFGFSHTNCHMVIEEALQATAETSAKNIWCLPITTRKQKLLLEYLRRYQKRCARDDWNVADLCYTAATGRGHYSCRLAILAETELELQENIAFAIQQLSSGDFNSVENRFYYGTHHVVSDKKTQKNADEITAKEKLSLTEKANSCLDQFTENGDKQALVTLAQNYCLGADPNWEILFTGEKRRKLSLPTYPFERVRYWADPKISKIQHRHSSLHPLVDSLHRVSANTWEYQTVFSPDTHWVLADHKIQEVCVVPGTTYLEMARFCALESMGWEEIQLQNIFFLQPMIIEEKQRRKVRTTLEKTEDIVRLTIESSAFESDADWQTHVEGKILPLPGLHKPENTTLSEIKQRAQEYIESYIGDSNTGVFQFGPHWDCVRSVWSCDDTTLAKLSLPSALQAELKDYKVHPSVLDNAMNLTSQISDKTYLPFMYKSFQIFAPFTPEMYSVILHKNDISGETNTYDVVLTDGAGNILAKAEGYVTKKVHDIARVSTRKNEFLSLRWLPASVDATADLPKKLWLVSDINTQLPKDLLNTWKAEGIAAEHIKLASNDEHVTDELFSRQTLPEAIVFYYPGLSRILENYAAIEEQTLHSFFRFAKALQKYKVRLPAGIVIVSHGAVCHSPQEQSQNPFASATGMLAIALAQETPDLNVRVVDTDHMTGMRAAELFGLRPGKRYLKRNQQYYCAELFPSVPPAAEQSSLRDNGVYLVTGGLGGLGLATAKYISARVKARIVLCGRSSIEDRDTWKIHADTAQDESQRNRYQQLLDIERQAETLHYIQADISDLASVRDLITSIEKNIGVIKGVFHTAGIAGNGFILRKSWDVFNKVLAAKTRGVCHLLASLNMQELDFCLLYSSITALTAGEGQADYAAANAFMDEIANGHEKIRSINWPSWAEVGMAAAFGVDNTVSPFEVIQADTAFQRMEVLLSGNMGRVIPGDINPDVLAQVLDRLPFTLSPELQSRLQKTTESEATTIDLEELDIRGKSEDELTGTETNLAKIYATVLGLQEIDVFTNFQDMGGNSIIATHLLKVIDEYYPGQVDISDIFSYPSIDVMAEYLDQKSIDHSSTDTHATTNWEKMLEQVEEGNDSIEDLIEKV